MLSLVIVGGSCQGGRISDQVNSSDNVNADNRTLNANSNIRAGTDPYLLINTDGWKLPALSSFTQKSKKTLAQNGVSIEQIDYQPDEDVVQVADYNQIYSFAKVSDMEKRSWRIQYLKVFSVQSKPFCYLMRGNWVETDQQGKIKSRLAMSNVLVYSDQDGDGLFETFTYSSAESPPIPGWVKRYR